MATDHDLSALMPDPPPPRPVAREAAVAEALRRFDGQIGEAPTPSASRSPARPAWARPQFALLASAVLVVLVSVPIWWAERDQLGRPAPAPEAPLDRAPPPAPVTASGSPPEASRLAEDDATVPAPAAPAESLAEANAMAERAPNAKAADAAPPAPTAVAALEAGSHPAPALRAPPAPPPGPPPAPALAQAGQRARQATAEASSDEEDRNIVVTGSRLERGSEARAPVAALVDAAPLDGEWNACTLHDPRRNPTSCRASARLSEGLALAWQGDLDRAIRAFDRAITTEPNLALAYLNRGLAYQQKGDLGRALADLNRAIARDRTGAQGYYHRSLLYRARGEDARADADAERAIGLDPDYAAALP